MHYNSQVIQDMSNIQQEMDTTRFPRLQIVTLMRQYFGTGVNDTPIPAVFGVRRWLLTMS